MPVRALVEAGALFGIAENNVRVALARLLAAGLVERDERGALPPRRRARSAVSRAGRVVARARRARAAVGRRLDRRAHRAARRAATRAAPPRARARSASSASATLRPGLALRPDNLAGGVAGGARAARARSGSSRDAPVFELRDLDAATRGARARGCGTPRALRRGLPRARAPRSSASERAARAPRARARRWSSRSGSAARRSASSCSIRCCPSRSCPPRERAALVEAMRRYDRAGPRLLGGLPRARFGVPPRRRTRRSPADRRTPRRTWPHGATRTALARGALARRDPGAARDAATGARWLSIAVDWALVAASFALVARVAEPAHGRSSRSS